MTLPDRDPIYEGVDRIAARLRDSLVDYLEASSHIRHLDVVKERRRLLERDGVVAQRPYIETTPSYKLGREFEHLGLPAPVGETLAQTMNQSPGARTIAKPYHHQAQALQAFFNRGRDLVVTTGTGSGKTEGFLWPMLGSLLLEARERPNSFGQHGVRALMLYPTNALVGDQLSRLRRLFGGPEVRKVFQAAGSRLPTFGTYTSRTPYPGEQDDKRDRDRLQPILNYYTATSDDQSELQGKLEAQGRWPAKNMVAFSDSGFKTGMGDSELFTRHEMQTSAPDILVTNYSMLEYMLIRPIERRIFEQTRGWLNASDHNQLVFVLDEAHLYRGSSGTEVALLIQRLLSRLGVSERPEKVRFILTSASLGDDASARNFAADLTGKDSSSFEVITSQREERPQDEPASEEHGVALANICSDALGALHLPGSTVVRAEMTRLAGATGWKPFDSDTMPLALWLYDVLYDYPPINLLISETTDGALDLEILAHRVFPSNGPERTAALNALLTLGAFARKNNRPLLPTRVHMMFRGISGLYACINPNCTARTTDTDDQPLLGALYTEPRVHCACGGRVFEMYSHSDCGAVFLRCFHKPGKQVDFLWHEQGSEHTLQEAFLLVGEPHRDVKRDDLDTLDVQVTTGRIDAGDERPDITARFRRIIPKKEGQSPRRFGVNFATCPVCLKRSQNFRIQSMRTTGEEPFGTLVRQQFAAQAPVNSESRTDPNGGKKALLFSDGRQRSARLARDLPRAVEFEAFRGAMVLAWKQLQGHVATPTLDARKLYIAFVSICSRHHLSFFDSESGDDELLEKDIHRFTSDFEEDLDAAIEDSDQFVVPVSFRMALARQLSDPKASLSRSCIAIPELGRRTWRSLVENVADLSVQDGESLLKTYVSGWILRYLDQGLVDSELTDDLRRMAIPNWERPNDDPVTNWRVDGLQCSYIDRALRQKLLIKDEVINLGMLTMRLAVDEPWVFCRTCGQLQDGTQTTRCLNCMSRDIGLIQPDSPQLNARIGYWRRPALDALERGRVMTVGVEEHSAQLSFRDKDRQYATTEEHELRFLGLPVGDAKRPIDILSCTTTMEVGIDIGALTAVGLRNIPPRRDNYQQRAGRAGRRGSSVSTVISFGQNGPHDSYYFHHPDQMIRGELVPPRIQRENERLAVRHFHAWMLQTFFHEQDSKLAKSAARPKGLFSTLGGASEFFAGSGAFSLQAMKNWIVTELPDRRAELQWLPMGIRHDLPLNAQSFIGELEKLVDSYNGDTAIDDSLLDVLFDHGFLPSYAFPTDVVSLTLFDQNGKIAEQPQTSRVQALSEYAPGRNVVVNKKTYRIGGLYDPFQEAKGIEPLLDKPDYYHYCTNCTFVTTSENGDSGSCPVCGFAIDPMPMIEPPGFAPLEATELRGNDTRQEYSAARRAQLPIPSTEIPASEWIQGPGVKMQRYYHRNRRLLVANVGDTGKGFAICPECGAAKPTPDKSSNDHKTPYPIPSRPVGRGRSQKGRSQRCSGTFQDQISLGTSFRSDVLLLRVKLTAPFATRIESSLVDAFWSAAEAIGLAASRALDIDANELSAGFRFLADEDDDLHADIYLYDTAAGGAGYAYAIGQDEMMLRKTLDDARTMLRDCPGKCDRSCNECLKNYRNQFDDMHLDRHLGIALLDYVIDGVLPQVAPLREEALLRPLEEYFELEDGTMPEQVRVHSVLRTAPRSSNGTVWLSDYILLRNLPDASIQVRR